jgi:lambda family phage tail tape measure protein
LVTSIKQMDGLIAQEKAQLKTREQDIARAVTAEFITTAEGLKQKREAIADDYAQTQALYAKEAAAVEARKAKLNPSTDKKAIAEQDKLLAEIEAKRALAAQASAAAMVQATGEQFKIQNDFNRATNEWVRQQGLANDAQQFSIDLMGKGALEAAQLTAARKTYLDVEEKIRLLRKKDPNADISGIIAARDAQIASGNALLAERDAKQNDPWFNASESIRKYGAAANDVGSQIGASMTNAFKGAEDAFVQFATTGKLSFNNLATSIIADIARMGVRSMMGSIIGSLFPGMGGMGGTGGLFGSAADAAQGQAAQASNNAANQVAGARASGGPTNAGSTYLVGEKGPELFSPTSAGTIIPNGSFGGSAGSTVHYSPVIQIDSRTDQADVHRLVSSAVQQGNAHLIDQLQRAGRL